MLPTYLLALLMLGCIGLLYLTNRHQRFIAKPISKQYRLVGYSGLLLALGGWLLLLSLSSAILIWLIIIMSGLILVPAASLTRRS